MLKTASFDRTPNSNDFNSARKLTCAYISDDERYYCDCLKQR